MSRILAIDLGKFKSVTCLLDTATNQTEFWTMSTDRQYLLAVLKHYAPELVVIESCSLAGWVHDVCTAEGYRVLVCNPNQEAWKWKHVKRKTDRDDALKLAKLAALEQLVPVYIPGRQQREQVTIVDAEGVAGLARGVDRHRVVPGAHVHNQPHRGAGDLAIGPAEIGVAEQLPLGRRVTGRREDAPQVVALLHPRLGTLREGQHIDAQELGDGLGNRRADLAELDRRLEQ